MDAQSGCDQPRKAQQEASKGIKAESLAVSGNRWHARLIEERCRHQDVENCCSETPLPDSPTASLTKVEGSMWKRQRHEQHSRQQVIPFLQSWSNKLQQILHMMTLRPFTDPTYCGKELVQAHLILWVTVLLVPFGVALQLCNTAGFTGVDKACVGPWAGVLYVAAGVPVARLIAAPITYVLCLVGELAVFGWPMLTKLPMFSTVTRKGRFAWLTTSWILLVWQSVVFKYIVDQPMKLWNRQDMGVDGCGDLKVQADRHACSYHLANSICHRVLLCIMLVCLAACLSAIAAIWAFYKVLRVHDLVNSDRHRRSPLLLQELYDHLMYDPKYNDDTKQITSGGSAERPSTWYRPRQLLPTVPEHTNHLVAAAAVDEAAAAAAATVPVWQQSRSHSNQSQQLQQRQPQQRKDVLRVSSDSAFSEIVQSIRGPLACVGNHSAAAACALVTVITSLATFATAVAVAAAAAPTAAPVAVAAAVVVPAAFAATVGAAFTLVAMFTPPMTTSCSAFGSAAWTCSAAAVAAVAAVVAAALGSKTRAAAAANGGVALPNAVQPWSTGLAISAAVAAVAAAVTLVLQYLAVEDREPDSSVRKQRVNQASSCQTLTSSSCRCHGPEDDVHCRNRSPLVTPSLHSSYPSVPWIAASFQAKPDPNAMQNKASSWQTLISITSNLEESLEIRSLSLDCLRDSNLVDQEFQSAWESEGAQLFRRLCRRVVPHKDPLTVISLSQDEVKLVLQDFASTTVTTRYLLRELDVNKDGRFTEPDAKAFLRKCHNHNLCVVLNLADMLAIIDSMEGGLHIFVQVMFGVLYVTLFNIGTWYWSATVALMIVGFAWMCGNLFRHTIAVATWLLFSRPYAVGDVIQCLEGEWRVLRIGLSTTTIQGLATGVPHAVSNSELATSLSIANFTRCDTLTASIKVSIVGMPAGRLDEFIDLLKAAAASHAAAHPSFYEDTSVGVQVGGDRLVCNGSTDFVEAELVVHWVSACPTSDTRQLQQAKAGMLKVVRQQYSLFMEPADASPPMAGLRAWQSNPVYRSAEF